jgi:hypothetical protein
MEESVIIPNNLDQFHIGTRYKVQYPDGDWSEERIVSRLCFSMKKDLWLLIDQKRIKILLEN